MANVGNILKKKEGEKIAAITSYNWLFAKIVDEVGVDVILVGDSMANVLYGEGSTIPISLDVMIHHAKSVVKAVEGTMVVFDMPFGSYQISAEDAKRNVIRVMKEAGVDGVKFEGGAEIGKLVEEVVMMGVPVMGHIGLLPQRVGILGGYRVQGRDEEAAKRLIEDAKALESAGVFSIVLEAIPYSLAQIITGEVKVPTIGIGAGPYCDGQIIVLEDILGLTEKVPSFVRRYESLRTRIKEAVMGYVEDVRRGRYPVLEESYR